MNTSDGKVRLSVVFTVALFILSLVSKTVLATSQPVSIIVCHKAGNSGNYTKNTVSIHSVDDINGLDGHGEHRNDVWSPFVFNNQNYSGQGNYNSMNFSNCVINTDDNNNGGGGDNNGDDDGGDSNGDNNNDDGNDETTPDPSDVCTNIDGVQTSLPGKDWYFVGEGSTICRQFEYGGSSSNGSNGGQVLGASTGQVLGASTMAATGSFAETFYQAIMGIGGLLTAKGIKKLKISKKK